mgnify:FL=1
MQALVSIIIPCFDREDLLPDTLESVLNQTYTNWECVIVDDHSADATPKIGKEYAARDGRIILVKRPLERPKGAASCRNIGLERTKGKFIQFLDSDDLLHPHKLEFHLKYARERVLLTGRWGYFSGEDLFERFKYKQKSYRNFRNPLKLLVCFGRNDEFMPLHSYLIPRELIEKAGEWKEDLGNNDDAEYMSRVLLHASRVKFVPDALVFYRVEGKSTLSGFSTYKNAESAVASLRYLEHNLSEHPKIRRRYLDNLKANIGGRIKEAFPELYEKNTDLWT